MCDIVTHMSCVVSIMGVVNRCRVIVLCLLFGLVHGRHVRLDRLVRRTCLVRLARFVSFARLVRHTRRIRLDRFVSLVRLALHICLVRLVRLDRHVRHVRTCLFIMLYAKLLQLDTTALADYDIKLRTNFRPY